MFYRSFVCLVLTAIRICLDAANDTTTKASFTNNSTTKSPTIESATTLITITNTAYPKIALRAFYVIAVLSALVIVYFIVRAVCLKRRKSKMKRYGVIRENTNDHMEMRPLSELEDDEDDDDMTLFDMSKQKRRSKR